MQGSHIMKAFSKKNTGILFSLLPIFLIFVILLINNFYTFCWSDESFYISSVHRLVNGDCLFTDEWHPTLFYEPLLLPFYHLYVFFTGGTEGIYLTARIAQLLLRLSTCLFLFFTLRKQSGNIPAMVSAVLLMPFLRANIKGLSYYALSLDFFLLGILYLYNFYLIKKNYIQTFLAGLFFAFAVLCNPFVAFIYIGYSVWYLAKSIKKKESIKPGLFIWGGTVLAASFYILYLCKTSTFVGFLSSFHNIFETPNYQKTSLYDTLISPLKKYIVNLLKPYKYSLPFFIASTITLLVFKIKKIGLSKKIEFPILVLNIIFFIYNLKIKRSNPGSIFVALTFFACILILLYQDKIIDKNKYILFFAIPGILLSVAWSYCSDTKYTVFPIGYSMAMPAMICLIYELSSVAFSNHRIRNIFTILLFCILTTMSLFQRFYYIYRDRKNSELVCKIEAGPAKGLFTEEKRKQKYDTVYTVISKISADYPGKSIYITPMIPWAYLLLDSKYAGPSTWRGYLDDKQVYNYFEKDKHPYPDLILMTNEEYTIDSPYKIPNSEYARFLLEKYAKIQQPIGELWIRKE